MKHDWERFEIADGEFITQCRECGYCYGEEKYRRCLEKC